MSPVPPPKAKPTPSIARQTVMARVRYALGRSPNSPVSPPPQIDHDVVCLIEAQDTAPENLMRIFAQRATDVGMTVHRAAAADLAKTTAALVEKLKIQKLAIAAGTLPQALVISDALRRTGVKILDWQASPGLRAQYDLDAAITDVHAALAETGTLVCSSDAGHSRGLSLVPPIHIAIVRSSDILPDMLDYWTHLTATPPADRPSSQVFITGPSKTSDIEGVLITGVHGPVQVHVILVKDA